MFNLGVDVLCRGDAPCVRGWRFPLCWRCSGIVAGTLLGLVLVGLGAHRGAHLGMQLVLAAALALPSVLEYVALITTPYHSNHLRRLSTGFLLGIANAVVAAVITDLLLSMIRNTSPLFQ